MVSFFNLPMDTNGTAFTEILPEPFFQFHLDLLIISFILSPFNGMFVTQGK